MRCPRFEGDKLDNGAVETSLFQLRSLSMFISKKARKQYVAVLHHLFAAKAGNFRLKRGEETMT